MLFTFTHNALPHPLTPTDFWEMAFLMERIKSMKIKAPGRIGGWLHIRCSWPPLNH